VLGGVSHLRHTEFFRSGRTRRLDQPGLVGEYDRLDSVTEVERGGPEPSLGAVLPGALRAYFHGTDRNKPVGETKGVT
jgi:hypothetical protein